MKILGIDPGLGRLGYGIIERNGSRLIPISFGLVETKPSPVSSRLYELHREIRTIIGQHQPDCLASERLLFTKNTTTAMDVAKALGCVLLAAEEAGLDCHEYSPPEVKLSVTGTGSGTKSQVQFMVTRLLSLASPPRPDDVADALAVAITHALRSGPTLKS